MLKDGDEYRMYYRAGGENSREYAALATSVDGITWKRTNLGIFDFNGSKENNIIWSGKNKAYWECHNFSPFIDQNPSCKPGEKYKAVSFIPYDVDGDGENERTLLGYVSPDGIHWKRLRTEPIITKGGGFDSHNIVFWDDNLKSYACYSRASKNGYRWIQRCVSKDFLNWGDYEMLEFNPEPMEHFYTNAIIPYFRNPRIYLGFPMRFVPDRKTIGLDKKPVDALSDAVFISSHDGVHFTRYFLEGFIRPGLDPKNWGNGHGNQTPAWGLFALTPEEISIYWLENYDYNNKSGRPCRLRRGGLRTDGFVSVNAPYKGGEFTTKPFIFSGSSLYINYATSAVGFIKVEIQDAAGAPLPGFDIQSSEEIFGDEIKRKVTWKNTSDVKSLEKKAVRLRFIMKDADIYSFQFD